MVREWQPGKGMQTGFIISKAFQYLDSREKQEMLLLVRRGVPNNLGDLTKK